MIVKYDVSLSGYQNEIAREDVRNTIQQIIDANKEDDFTAMIEEEYHDGIDDDTLYSLLRDEWTYYFDMLEIEYDY